MLPTNPDIDWGAARCHADLAGQPLLADDPGTLSGVEVVVAGERPCGRGLAARLPARLAVGGMRRLLPASGRRDGKHLGSALYRRRLRRCGGAAPVLSHVPLAGHGDGAVVGAHAAGGRQHAAGHQQGRGHPRNRAAERRVLFDFHALRFIRAPGGASLRYGAPPPKFKRKCGMTMAMSRRFAPVKVSRSLRPVMHSGERVAGRPGRALAGTI